MPPLDLDRFELDSDDDNDIDMWCEDFWDLWLQTQRVVHNVGRSLDEILRLEVEIIEDNWRGASRVGELYAGKVPCDYGRGLIWYKEPDKVYIND